MTNLTEKWVPVINFPNYLISSFGRFQNRNTGRILRSHNTMKRNNPNKIEGCTVKLSKQGKQKTHHIHKEVMKYFGKKKPDLTHSYSIDHIDRDPTNNQINNLRWATPKEQARNSSCFKGLKKFTLQDLYDVENRMHTESLRIIAKSYNVNYGTLHKLMLHMHPSY